MNDITFTLSANAGLSVTVKNTRIWIDALPGRSIAGYSTLSAQQWEQVFSSEDFINPDLIFFTHCHPDHYSQELAERVRNQYPSVPLVMPEKHFPDQYLLTGKVIRAPFKDVALTFLSLPHEAARYRNVPQYALLIDTGRVTILAAGDTETASDALRDYLTERQLRPDVAVLPFPWITLKRGRAYIEEILRPSHLLINHIPFPEDDRNRYRDAIRHALPEMSRQADLRLMTRPLQKEIISFPAV